MASSWDKLLLTVGAARIAEAMVEEVVTAYKIFAKGDEYKERLQKEVYKWGRRGGLLSPIAGGIAGFENAGDGEWGIGDGP